MHARPFARLAALAAAGALAVSTMTVTTLVGAPAQAADPAPSAATWLTGQLTNGLIRNPNFGGFDDIGLTIDTAVALDAVGGQGAVLGQIRAAVEPKVAGYVEYSPAGDGQLHVTAGAVAKAAVLAQVTGADPAAYGGQNLIGKLEERVASTAPVTGRVGDKLVTGDSDPFTPGDQPDTDYANVYGQALAVRALTKAGSARAADATAFLLKQQCSAGYFRLDFNTDRTAAAQGCVDGDSSGSPADPDATSTAVLQLVAGGSADPAVKSAIAKAVAWLKAQQKADGSLGGGVTTEASNSNSTGLAAWVLAGQGECLAAGKAASWVRALQVPAGAGGALAPSVGAVAYDQAAYDAAKTGGITDATADQWRRATSQAAPGLAATLSPTIANVTGPADFVRAGSKQQVVLHGVTAGDNVCYRDNGSALKALKLSSSPFIHAVTVPDRTANATYGFTAVDGEKTFTIKTLAALKIKTKVRKKVRLGKKQLVRLKGLAGGERVKVKVNGKVVKRGKAKANGKFKAKLRMTKKLAKKRKKARLVVIGHFNNRRNTKLFKVVRPKNRKH